VSTAITTMGARVNSRAPDALPLTVTAAAKGLRDGSYTSVDLVQAMQRRADVLDPVLASYIVRTDETALAAAAIADAELASGLDRGLFHGIPIGIKDIIATAEAPTTAQSLVLDPAFGASGDAVVVSRLRAAGAIVMGKLTTMEYAIGTPDPSKGFPTPRNPFNHEHWTGGSSSGTGNGVAAGLFLAGLGTDTGGSIRLPAAWCGISGLMQTFGRVPKSGCVPLGFSYDHIGPMTRSARDAAAMLAVLAGHDESDPSSIDRPVDDYLAALTGDLTGLRIGIDSSFLHRPGCDPKVSECLRDAVAVLIDAGATVTEVRLPLWDEVTTSMMVGLAEAAAYHLGDLRTRWDDYGRPTRHTIGLAVLATAADYVQAQRVRRVGIRAVAEMFETYDLVITPTALTGAPALAGLDFEAMLPDVLTPYWNAVGNPAISIPAGLTAAGLPIGLQIAGRPFDEATVLRAADAFQRATDHHLVESPLVLELLS
jgi:aspartyl-tRNA(Asn)/glutamyl-tRNA(Gln) amidotransferase subunit A